MDLPALFNATPTRADIDRLEATLLSMADGQVELEVLHHFAPGLYGREMRAKAGQVIVGAEHLTDHLASFHGDMTIWTEGGCTRLTGHHVLTSIAGAKRVGFAHADSVFVAWHHNPDNCRDMAVLEHRYVTRPELLQHNRLALEAA